MKNNNEKKYLSLKEKIAIAEFKKRLFQEFEKEILELKLFGSKARGDFKKDSDFDILLVLKKISKKSKDRIYDLENEISFKYGIDISVKIFFQKEFNYLNSIPSVFAQLLKKESLAL